MQAQTRGEVAGAPLAAFWSDQQRRLSELLDRLVAPGARVLYVDYPVSTNVGDLLLYHGTEVWLGSRGHAIVGRSSILDFRFPAIGSDVVIVCQGGGNFGDLYRHQGFRESLVEHYPANRIIFLPQTLHYRSPRNLAASSRRLRAHPDLHLLLRDLPSLASAERHFSTCKHYLAPDMAVMLYPLAAMTTHSKIRERLCLFRRDIEQASTPLPASGPCDWTGDWKELLGSRYALLRLLQAVIFVTCRFTPSAVTASIWKAATWRAIDSCAREIARTRVVETSRLHGHIFASLLGVPSHLHDNSYGKNSAYYRAWHTAMPLPGSTTTA